MQLSRNSLTLSELRLLRLPQRAPPMSRRPSWWWLVKSSPASNPNPLLVEMQKMFLYRVESPSVIKSPVGAANNSLCFVYKGWSGTLGTIQWNSVQEYHIYPINKHGSSIVRERWKGEEKWYSGSSSLQYWRSGCVKVRRLVMRRGGALLTCSKSNY